LANDDREHMSRGPRLVAFQEQQSTSAMSAVNAGLVFGLLARWAVRRRQKGNKSQGESTPLERGNLL